MIKNKNKYNLFLVIAALATVSLFVSCSKGTKSASFTANIQQVDSYISSGDVNKALKYLKKAQKSAISLYERIGVYNRYILLGEDLQAEKVLVKSIKKIPDSQELKALYGHFLIERGNYQKALQISKSLIGSPYDSIYAEAVLRIAFSNNLTADEIFEGIKQKETKNNREELEVKRRNIFYDERFVPVYQSSYKVSKNPIWQINAASLYLQSGNYEKASSFYDGVIYNPFQSLFWGLVLYDSGYFGKSLESLLQSEDIAINNKALLLDILSLEADDYHILGDDKSSNKVRSKIIEIAQDDIYDDKVSKILPLVYMNNSRYGLLREDFTEQYKSLVELMNAYPDYEIGLAGYADYALSLMNRPKEDALSAELRSSGLRTLEMERLDAIPVITLTDVMDKIDIALSMNEDFDNNISQSKRSALIVLKQQIFNIVNKDLSASRKASAVWQMLESNVISGGEYPAEVIRYAVLDLIKANYLEDARELFTGYLNSKQKLDNQSDTENDDLNLWEREYMAFFDLLSQNATHGVELYTQIYRKYGSMNANMISKEQSQSVINACVNLGVIYSSLGMDVQSRDMFNTASSMCNDDLKKADILYRLAVEDYALGNRKSAVRELQYALSLDNSMNKARLMLKKLHAEE